MTRKDLAQRAEAAYVGTRLAREAHAARKAAVRTRVIRTLPWPAFVALPFAAGALAGRLDLQQHGTRWRRPAALAARLLALAAAPANEPADASAR